MTHVPSTHTEKKYDRVHDPMTHVPQHPQRRKKQPTTPSTPMIASPTSMDSETKDQEQDYKKQIKRTRYMAWVSTRKCERDQGSNLVFALTHHYFEPDTGCTSWTLTRRVVVQTVISKVCRMMCWMVLPYAEDRLA